MSLDITCLDTICAQSSAQGYGAIAIVRVSGPLAFKILSAIFVNKSQEIKNFTAMHGDICDQNNQVIDDVVAIYFPEHKSFTGETCFEVHCHGNQIIISEILNLICSHGARLATPGEFSLRAMLNNKIDLAQAESICDLIHAKSITAKNIALSGVRGGLYNKTSWLRDLIISVLAEFEARMDFPDEDLGAYDKAKLSEAILAGANKLAELITSANYGLKLHQGARVVIIGLPNAGKSTLLNNLSGEERAIVHHEAGTTRDVIEVELDLFGVPIVLVDVAGIRDLNEAGYVEQLGINKAYEELNKAHGVIWLADSTSKNLFDHPVILDKLAKLEIPILRVLNKCDLLNLMNKSRGDGITCVSARENLGLDLLRKKLFDLVVGETKASSEIFITRARQRDELILAQASLQQAYIAMRDNQVDEVITSELRCAGYAFDRLFGQEISEDILDKIFSDFCIGK